MLNKKKNLLLSQATLLFATRGYDAVGISEIVQNCGVTKPTLYHYFKSKSGLLKSIYTCHLPGLLKNLQIFEKIPNRDLKSTLEHLTSAWLLQAKEKSDFFRLLLSASAAPPRSEARLLLQPYEKQLRDSLESLFKTAANIHGNMKNRETRYARIFLALLNMLTLEVIDGHFDFESNEIYLSIHQFMHGILS